MGFIVTWKAKRPASAADECFYCRQQIGSDHGAECVLVIKMQKLKISIEVERPVPAHWDQKAIEFFHNEGTWCADNAIDWLKQVQSKDGCLCRATRVDYLDESGDPFLDEDGKEQATPVTVDYFAKWCELVELLPKCDTYNCERKAQFAHFESSLCAGHAEASDEELPWAAHVREWEALESDE